MAMDNESFMREYADEITDIVKAIGKDPNDESARREIADCLVQSLKMARRRAGKNQSVKDTDLYKLAYAVRQAKTEAECAWLVKQFFPRRWSIIFDSYNFDWKIPCEEMRKKQKRSPGARKFPGDTPGEKG